MYPEILNFQSRVRTEFSISMRVRGFGLLISTSGRGKGLIFWGWVLDEQYSGKGLGCRQTGGVMSEDGAG